MGLRKAAFFFGDPDESYCSVSTCYYDPATGTGYADPDGKVTLRSMGIEFFPEGDSCVEGWEFEDGTKIGRFFEGMSDDEESEMSQKAENALSLLGKRISTELDVQINHDPTTGILRVYCSKANIEISVQDEEKPTFNVSVLDSTGSRESINAYSNLTEESVLDEVQRFV